MAHHKYRLAYNTPEANPILVLCLMISSDCKASAGEDDGGYSEVHVRKKKKRCSGGEKMGRCSGEKNGETFVVTVLSDT